MDVQPIPPTLGPEFRTEILLLLQWGAVRGAPISFRRSSDAMLKKI